MDFALVILLCITAVQGAFVQKANKTLGLGMALDMQSNVIVGLAPPSLSTSAATKGYVEAALSGMRQHFAFKKDISAATVDPAACPSPEDVSWTPISLPDEFQSLRIDFSSPAYALAADGLTVWFRGMMIPLSGPSELPIHAPLFMLPQNVAPIRASEVACQSDLSMTECRLMIMPSGLVIARSQVGGGWISLDGGHFISSTTPTLPPEDPVWVSCPLINGWTNAVGWQPCEYAYWSHTGRILFRGVITGGTSNTMFGMPKKYRPPTDVTMMGTLNDGNYNALIKVNGGGPGVIAYLELDETNAYASVDLLSLNQASYSLASVASGHVSPPWSPIPLVSPMSNVAGKEPMMYAMDPDGILEFRGQVKDIPTSTLISYVPSLWLDKTLLFQMFLVVSNHVACRVDVRPWYTDTLDSNLYASDTHDLAWTDVSSLHAITKQAKERLTWIDCSAYFLNGWVQYGSSWELCSFTKRGNQVLLQGFLNGGDRTPGTPVLQLPQEYAPPQKLLFGDLVRRSSQIRGNSYAVDTNGTITIESTEAFDSWLNIGFWTWFV